MPPLAPTREIKARPADLEYFLWLDEFKVLHPQHLVDLTGRNWQATYRRLKQLRKGEFIARVKNPANFYAGPGLEPGYLVLTNKGATVLEDECGIPYRDRHDFIKRLNKPLREELKRRRRVYNMQHNILIPSLLTAFIRAARGTGMEVWAKRTLLEKLPMNLEGDTRPFEWVAPITVNGMPDVVGLRPDYTLALHYPYLEEKRQLVSLFVEIDNGTEAVYNSDLGQESWWRKMLGYAGTRHERLAERFFGMDAVMYALLLPDKARQQEILRMIDRQDVRNLPGFNPRQFIVNYHSAVEPGQDILGWINLNGEQVSFKR